MRDMGGWCIQTALFAASNFITAAHAVGLIAVGFVRSNAATCRNALHYVRPAVYLRRYRGACTGDDHAPPEM